MRVVKTKDVKLPERGTARSAGIDFFVPSGVEPFKLLPGEAVNIPSGIRAEVPMGYALIAFNKSGVATRKGLQVGACVVDEDYQGEIHLHLTNTSNSETWIRPNDKIVQFVLVAISNEPVTEVLFADALWDGLSTERGDGAFGSTGV